MRWTHTKIKNLRVSWVPRLKLCVEHTLIFSHIFYVESKHVFKWLHPKGGTKVGQ